MGGGGVGVLSLERGGSLCPLFDLCAHDKAGN